MSFKKPGHTAVVEVFAPASGPPRPSRPSHSPKLDRLRHTKGSEGAASPWPAAATQRRPRSACGDGSGDASGRSPRAARDPAAASLSGLQRRAGGEAGDARAPRPQIDAHTRRAGSSVLAAAEPGRCRPPRKGRTCRLLGASADLGVKRLERPPHHLASPGGPGGRRTPLPRPERSGFRAPSPLPSSPRVCPSAEAAARRSQEREEGANQERCLCT